MRRSGIVGALFYYRLLLCVRRSATPSPILQATGTNTTRRFFAERQHDCDGDRDVQRLAGISPVPGDTSNSRRCSVHFLVLRISILIPITIRRT